MALADEIAVKLGLKTTEFKAALASANAEVKNFKNAAEGPTAVGNAVDALGHHITNLRRLTGVLIASMGLDFKEIGENIARYIIGFSKEEEEALKRLGIASDALTKLILEGLHKEETEQQQYDRILNERISLYKKLAENRGQTTEEITEANELQAKLLLKDQEYADLLKKRRDREVEYIADVAAAEKKADEEYRKYQDDRIKKGQEEYGDRKRDEKELHDLKMASLAPDKQLVQLADEEKDLRLQIKQQKDFGVETTKTEIELQKNLNTQENIRATITNKTAKSEAEITAEKKKQLEAEKNRLASIAGIRGGNQFNDASDAALAETARRNRAQAQSIQGGQGGYGVAQNLEIARLIAEAMNAEKELAFRRNLMNTIEFQGEDAARRNFAGDPLQFDRVLQQLTGQQDKTSKGIQDLNDRLAAAGFTKHGG